MKEDEDRGIIIIGGSGAVSIGAALASKIASKPMELDTNCLGMDVKSTEVHVERMPGVYRDQLGYYMLSYKKYVNKNTSHTKPRGAEPPMKGRRGKQRW